MNLKSTINNFDETFINNSLNAANVYYPLFDVKAELQIATINTNNKETPEVVVDDFGSLVDIYSNPEQPIYFVECGYASSSVCNSSEELHSEFYRNVFLSCLGYVL